MTIKLLSLSGGGWNSMSNLAGAMAGSIDRLESNGLERKIDTLLDDYDYISGNSGGTWFLTSIGFLDEYQKSLEERTKADSYNNSGFNFNVKKSFDKLGYGGPEEIAVSNMLLQFRSNWGDFIKETVYDPIGDPASTNAKFTQSSLANWAHNKNITFATALTKKSNLNNSGEVTAESNQFFGPPIIEQGLLKNKIFASYTPTTPNAENYKASNFVPFSIEINKDGKSTYRTTDSQNNLSINYSNNQTLFAPDQQQKTLAKTGLAQSIQAIDPSIASSAAVAAAAFPSTYGKTGAQNQLAYQLASLAPIISFNKEGLEQINQEPKTSNNFQATLNNIAKNGYIRSADGGYLDNTSVAYNLSSAFNNGSLNRSQAGRESVFEISLFQNNSSSLSNLINIKGKNNTSALFPSDLAALFGLDNDPVSPSVEGVKIHPASSLWTLSSQVFTPNSLTESDLTPSWKWDQKDGGDIQLFLYTIDVETVANDAYGIQAGLNGKFNIYLSLNPSSNAIPFKKRIHEDYVDNFNSWRDAIEQAPSSINFFDSLDTVPPGVQGLRLSSDPQRVIGTNSSDVIKAHDGDDYLYGDEGKDKLIGGNGADTLVGGSGKDTFRYLSTEDSISNRKGRDTITDFQPDEDKIDLRPLSQDFDMRFIGEGKLNKIGDIRIRDSALHLNTDNDTKPEFKINLPGSDLTQFSANDLLLK